MLQTTSYQYGPKDFNTRTAIVINDSIRSEFESFIATKNPSSILLEFMTSAYNEGYGLKILCNTFGGYSYTKMRHFFIKHLPGLMRSGRKIVTDKTRKMRSERQVNSKDNAWRGDRMERSTRGIGGRYTASDGKSYWCRSTWEYVYVKWLISKGINFKMEEHSYQLKDGRTYRPDFFIYDSEWSKVEYIVEIKGQVFTNNIDKPALLEKEYGIKTIMISDIKPYCVGSDYGGYLHEWKMYLKQTGQVVHKINGIKQYAKNCKD